MAAELVVHPGRTRRGLIILVSALAVLAIWLAGVPGWVAAVLTLPVVAVAARAWQTMPSHRIRIGHRLPSALNGHPGVLRAEALSMFWAALRLETPDGAHHRALVFHDELDERDFRRLLAHLRHGQGG